MKLGVALGKAIATDFVVTFHKPVIVEKNNLCHPLHPLARNDANATFIVVFNFIYAVFIVLASWFNLGLYAYSAWMLMLVMRYFR